MLEAVMDDEELPSHPLFTILVLRAKRKKRISSQSGKFDSLYRTVGENAAELFLSHREDVVAGERQQFGLGLELGRGVAGGLTVVRAALLALVAAKDAVSYHALYPLWQVASVLDGEAREAAACVDGLATTQRPAGACPLTGSALLALVEARLVGLQLECREQHSQEEIRAAARDDELVVPPGEANAGSLCPVPLAQRCRIDTRPRLAPRGLLNGLAQLPQPLLDYLVVVAAVGIVGDLRRLWVLKHLGVVVHRHHYHRARPLEQQLGVLPDCVMVVRPVHAPVLAAGKPVVIAFHSSIIHTIDSCNAACVKAQFQGNIFYKSAIHISL